MNYFAHGRNYLDEPYFLAGTAIPDWLSVVDRRVRVRSKAAQKFVRDDDPQVAALARGVVQHHTDDDWFHRTRAFAELSLKFTAELRDWLPNDQGMRPSFLGHILVELLLDAVLIEQQPSRLTDYYAVLDGLDPHVIERAVERMAGRPAVGMARMIPLFSAERFLYDYAEDAKLLFRLNRVMCRVGLPQLPDNLCDYLPSARKRVRQNATQLMQRESA